MSKEARSFWLALGAFGVCLLLSGFLAGLTAFAFQHSVAAVIGATVASLLASKRHLLVLILGTLVGWIPPFHLPVSAVCGPTVLCWQLAPIVTFAVAWGAGLLAILMFGRRGPGPGPRLAAANETIGRHFGGIFWATFLVVLGSGLWQWLDLAGLDTASEHHSQRVLLRLMAANYSDENTDVSQFERVAEESFEPWTTLAEEGAKTPRSPQSRIVTVYVSEKVIANNRENAEGLGWEAWRPDYLDFVDIVRSLTGNCEYEMPEAVEGGGVQSPACASGWRPTALFIDGIFLERGEKEGYPDPSYPHFEAFIDVIKEFTRYTEWSSAFHPTDCDTALERLICINAVGGVPIVVALPLEHPATMLVPSCLTDCEAGSAVVRVWEDGVVSPAQQALAEVAIRVPAQIYAEDAQYYPLVRPVRPEDKSSVEIGDVLEGTNSKCESNDDRVSFYQDGRLRFSCIATEPTPALILYTAFCLRFPDECPAGDGEGRHPWRYWHRANESGRAPAIARDAEQRIRQAFATPLLLRWGVRVPDHYTDLKYQVGEERPVIWSFDEIGFRSAAATRRLECRNESRSFADGVARIFPLMFHQVFGSGLPGIRQECLFHLEIPYSLFYARRIQPPVESEILDGSIIIFGGRYANTPDQTTSIVHGLIPAHHRHAMALDNLMSSHGDYLRAPAQIGWQILQLDQGAIIEITTILAVTILSYIAQIYMFHWHVPKAQLFELTEPKEYLDHIPLGLRILGNTLVAILIIPIGIVLMRQFILMTQTLPVDWIGILVIPLTSTSFIAGNLWRRPALWPFRQTPWPRSHGRCIRRLFA